MIQIQQTNPYKLPATFYVVVQFPLALFIEGKEYRRTGKDGINVKTGVPSAEYRAFNHSGDKRAWMDANEIITPD